CFRLEAPVDAVRLRLHFGDKVLIALDTRAAWSPELNKGELLTVLRIFIQKTFDSAKALQKPFRIVDAIYAHSQKQGIRTELSKNLRSILLRSHFLAGVPQVFR